MANIVNKDNGGQQQAQPPKPQTNQPSQQQRGELVKRDPFQQFMRNPFQLMQEFLVDPFRVFGSWGREAWNVSFDVRESNDAFIFKADMPGLRSEDIDITLTGNQLQISGKRDYEHEQDEGRMHSYERSYGTFCRTFALPESADVDKIRSDLKDGVLTLVVPKKAGTSQQSRKIEIGAGSKA